MLTLLPLLVVLLITNSSSYRVVVVRGALLVLVIAAADVLLLLLLLLVVLCGCRPHSNSSTVFILARGHRARASITVRGPRCAHSIVASSRSWCFISPGIYVDCGCHVSLGRNECPNEYDTNNTVQLVESRSPQSYGMVRTTLLSTFYRKRMKYAA